VQAVGQISNAAEGGLSFPADGWVLASDGQHLGRIDETGHVWRLNGTLLGRLDDQGYVRNQFGGVLGRIDEGDATVEAVRRQLWEWLGANS
jgi:hypothetical protein